MQAQERERKMKVIYSAFPDKFQSASQSSYTTLPPGSSRIQVTTGYAEKEMHRRAENLCHDIFQIQKHLISPFFMSIGKTIDELVDDGCGVVRGWDW